jgi:hypothetical protein
MVSLSGFWLPINHQQKTPDRRPGLKSLKFILNPQAQPPEGIMPVSASRAPPANANRAKQIEEKDLSMTLCFSFPIITEIHEKGKRQLICSEPGA